MSELYIYDDDLVEDYNVIETFTKTITNSTKKNKMITKETNTKTNTNKSEEKK
jgi:hypothetical protein